MRFLSVNQFAKKYGRSLPESKHYNIILSFCQAKSRVDCRRRAIFAQNQTDAQIRIFVFGIFAEGFDKPCEIVYNGRIKNRKGEGYR